MTRKNSTLTAMGFYHANGLVPAFQQAIQFAGEGGRIATMEDVARLRLNTNPGDTPWETYYTTMTGEYFGHSKAGNRIIIVAHGVGPMQGLDGVLAAYSFEFRDKSRNHRGGRITVQQFLDLEAGKYGDVHVIDFEQLFKLFEYPFMGCLRASEALKHPLLMARLGAVAEDLIAHHAKWAKKYHEEKGHGTIDDPFIVTPGAASNCSYGWPDIKDHSLVVSPFLDRNGLPLAHLVSTGSLSNVHHQDSRVPCMMNDVACHEWWNGVRLLAIKAESKLDSSHPGINANRTILRHWTDLMIEVEQPSSPSGFFALMMVGKDRMFTQYLKAGACMDTCEPEFLVTEARRVPGPKTFTTTIGGYHGFFKYDIKEVERIAPQGANAYYLPGEVEIVWEGGNPEYHVTPIEFYRVDIDNTKRVMRAADLANNFELIMRLVETENAA